MKSIFLKVKQNYIGMRIDKVISIEITNYSRTYISKLIKSENVEVDGVIIKEPDYKLNGKLIKITFIEDTLKTLKPEEFQYDILYEDDYLIIINKPPGVVVHPAPGNWDNTVVNALIGRDNNFTSNFQDELNSFRPGIVHRLDKDTSGVLIIAKNPQSKYKLCKQFSDGSIKKEYIAIVCGIPKNNYKEITTLIGRHPINRKKMAVVNKNGRMAKTIYRLIKSGKIEDNKVSVLSVRTITGRTHQIRVHLAYDKIPILGDSVYGGHQNIKANRQMLHASKLRFIHPIDNREMIIECPLFEDQQQLLDMIDNVS